ncbi:MAG: PEP-CTERM sorting domain-containing protein [Phycisphaerales bacterium]|nr:PEP-CTERM sorting domain-containing protein [Phycisphaerales bacterium]
MNMLKITALVLSAGIASSAAQAELFVWDWAVGDTHAVNTGGTFDSIRTTYDDTTSVFTWEMTFSDQITDGFTLAVNNGPNPLGHAGEFALLYFDATDTDDLRLSAFAYNGEDTQQSYIDGSPDAGIQAPDEIYNSVSILDQLLSASVTDLDGSRTFAFSLDTSVINAYSPVNPGPGGDADWSGMQFGQYIGAWVHPVTELATEYDNNGSLIQWGGREGFIDTSWKPTTPAPGTFALLGLGGMVISRRRR